MNGGSIFLADPTWTDPVYFLNLSYPHQTYFFAFQHNTIRHDILIVYNAIIVATY
mgnify:CR=1 FL=1